MSHSPVGSASALPACSRPKVSIDRLVRRRSLLMCCYSSLWRILLRILRQPWRRFGMGDRKSTRLNSSHVRISYAVFCLKKKKTTMFTSHVNKDKSLNMKYLNCHIANSQLFASHTYPALYQHSLPILTIALC